MTQVAARASIPMPIAVMNSGRVNPQFE